MTNRKLFFLRDESGQSLIITALAMMCLVGFLALATDVGVLFRDKVNLQKVADAAAIAGAAELKSGNYTGAAQASATQNGVTNGTNGTVTVTTDSPYHPGAVKVYVSQSEKNFFMSLFGQRTTTVGATAVASLTTSDACMYALDTAPFKNEGMDMNGTGDLEIKKCAIYDNADLVMNGKSGVINAKFIGVVGSFSGNGAASPTPITGMVAVPDPMSYWSTPPSYGTCANDPKASKGVVTPGCYKALTVSGTAALQPGLYVIDGGLSITTQTPATGVTFYIDGSKGGTLVSTDGANISAPRTGSSGTCTTTQGCNGILIWDTETTGKAQQGISFGPHGSTLTGILYFPNAALKFHGDTTTTLNADIIAMSYAFDGTININNYVLGSGQAPILVTPTLLE